MSDETIRVVYDVTEKGMENVRRLVADIRKELGTAGVDTARFESRLAGLERVVQKVNSALKTATAAASTASKAGEANAAKNSSAWAKVKKEIAEANAEYRKFERGQVTGEGGGRPLSSFSQEDLSRFSAARKAENADIVADYERTKRAQVAADKKAASESARIAAEQNRLYNQYMEAQYAADKRAADRAIAERQRVLNEYNKGMSGTSSDASLTRALNGPRGRTDSQRSLKAADVQAWENQFAKATAAAGQFRGEQDNIIAQRYALYDVASTYGIIGAALAGAAIYAGVVGAQFESAFTNVERTLQGGTLPAEVQAIRQSLVDLSGQIPLTFQQLSEIATIGNQMGIAKEDIIDFTGTIARFASVSGLSIDTVTKAFGGFMAQTGLAPEYLENLGASIAKVGIDSNATEEQIVSLMREITAGARNAGFTADQIIGLSGTLAGLQIAPERARGALSTYFNTLNMAVAEGGDKLAAFATVVGTTSAKLEEMVRAGQGSDILRSFLEGLNNAGDNVELTQALDALNLSQLRVSDTFIRLSSALRIYDRDQRNANSAFMEGAELQRQYSMTVDDLASQWTIFINNLNGLVDAISGGAIPSLAALFGAVNNVITALSGWIGDNQWVAGVLAFATATAGALGVIILFRSASLAATAALLALRVLTQQAGASAIVAAGGFRGLIGTLFGVQSAAGAAAGGIFTLRAAIRALLASTGIGLLVTLGGSLIEGMMGQGDAASDAALSLDEYNKAMKDAQAASQGAADGAGNLADQLGGGGGGGGVSGAAENAAQKVRTLVDYVNDLNGVFDRSSDLRFGSSAAMDEITLKWIELNEEAQKYQQEIRSLTADRKLQQYWLGIAELYDDQIRASQIRENIAEIDDKMAVAQQGASRELVGNSRAAIENRQTMRDLLGSYEEYVSALIAAGASQEQIQAIISRLNGDFTNQARDLGFAGGELITYKDRFNDLATVVANMPAEVTVGFNPDPAQQAMNEFFAKAAADAALAGGTAGDNYAGALGGGIDDSLYDYDALPSDIFSDPAKTRGAQAGTNWWDSMMKSWQTGQYKWIPLVGAWMTQIGTWWNTGGRNWAISVWNGFIDELNYLIAELKKINLGGWSPFEGLGTLPKISNRSRSNGGGGGFADGGYTGPGHWLEPAGIVHKGEYVIPAKHVNQRTGLPDPTYVNSLRKSKSAGPGYAMGGHVAGGGWPAYMELGPMTIQRISDSLRVTLGVDGRELAAATSQGDQQLAWAGSN